MPSKPPAHLAEEVFRRYEKNIFSIVSRYPNKTTFDPRPFSAITFSARLRDAIRSHCIYKWPSAVDPASLAAIRPKIIVIKDEAGMVVIKERDKPSTLSSELVDQYADNPNRTITIDSPKDMDIWSCAWLLGRRILTGPIRFINANKKAIDEVRNSGYDIVLTHDEATNTTTII